MKIYVEGIDVAGWPKDGVVLDVDADRYGPFVLLNANGENVWLAPTGEVTWIGDCPVEVFEEAI